ncbi:DUF6716 putative glycosyltransferase [Paeniglutamicibacter cryotolerans]|uniref:Uncharacterized protein n=1 Tax=Paeniglutamicibacter cryotolerans TaxID=670079 RepID=A0A839QJJ3_9MICC|nr:DUF6716 putative glycosyltransferase [Paeniglutamicibacter cryotolerans]MBB2994904.1 hypothetical protein [Paeniglutamicibacter cryotolerans]
MNTTRPVITAVADSDSYLKLACATLEKLGPGWDRKVLLVRSPLLPTTEQLGAATLGTFMEGINPRILPMGALPQALRGSGVVFAAATGPIVQELFARITAAAPDGIRRSALVSALPGVALPATKKAMRFRSLADAFITHSHAEAEAFSGLCAELGTAAPERILVAKLPFLHSRGFPAPDPAPVTRLVFAAQAKVPSAKAEREQLLLALDRASRLNPQVEVLVKVRAWPGEPQTHLEPFPYDELHDELLRSGRLASSRVRFRAGSMAALLTPGTALATVSSTAALESLDRGLRTLILSDFGVNQRLLNAVFEGSGLLGTLDDAAAMDFGRPGTAWLRENYFHAADVEPEAALRSLALRAAGSGFRIAPERIALAAGISRKAKVRTALPRPALRAVRRLRRMLQGI